MSTHTIKTTWIKNGEFSHNSIDRHHTLNFHEDVSLISAGANTSDAADPEQLLAAALSSCYMQTFLILAAKKRLVVESYSDEAVAELSQRDDGRFWVSKITLNPTVKFSNDKIPDKEVFIKMHKKSHDHCFVANSLNCTIDIAPILND